MKYQVLKQSIDKPNECELLGTVDPAGKDNETVMDEITEIKARNLQNVKFPESNFLTCDIHSDHYQH